jgi:hypothetical protein
LFRSILAKVLGSLNAGKELFAWRSNTLEEDYVDELFGEARCGGVLHRWRWEDNKLEASLDYVARPCPTLKINK